ncbi:hypothetical protein B0H11DRAFT_1302116 [Mycena galericulata]|nr:hypothetical protein B0H11DRAFT_1302116 [Mycena galericulata]
MSAPLPVHPCYADPSPKSALKPDTTFTLRYIKLRPETIPPNYPYQTPLIPGLFANKGVHEHVPIPFFEFRGAGAPPLDIGTPGDAYIDTAAPACALYTRAEEEWMQWAGPAAPELFTHPHFVDCRTARHIWFHPRDGVEWISGVSVKRRRDALRAEGVLTAAHTPEDREAGLALAAEIIANYLAGKTTTASPAPSLPRRRVRKVVLRVDTAKAESEGEEMSSDEEFYPPALKRVRLTYPADWAAVAPSVDLEITRLWEEKTALEVERERLAQRLMTLNAEKTMPAQNILQLLEKEYKQYHSLPSMTETDFEALNADLQGRIDAAKASLCVKQLEREELEKQTEERRQICNERKERQNKIRALCEL